MWRGAIGTNCRTNNTSGPGGCWVTWTEGWRWCMRAAPSSPQVVAAHMTSRAWDFNSICISTCFVTKKSIEFYNRWKKIELRCTALHFLRAVVVVAIFKGDRGVRNLVSIALYFSLPSVGWWFSNIHHTGLYFCGNYAQLVWKWPQLNKYIHTNPEVSHTHTHIYTHTVRLWWKRIITLLQYIKYRSNSNLLSILSWPHTHLGGRKHHSPCVQNGAVMNNEALQCFLPSTRNTLLQPSLLGNSFFLPLHDQYFTVTSPPWSIFYCHWNI